MLKKAALFIVVIFPLLTARAQSADSVYNKYLDFNLARFQDQQDKAFELGQNLVPLADKLPEKARISFYFSIGKMYEDNNEIDKAQPFYEKVAAAVPDYYVVHRALGYLYLDKAKAMEQKLSAATTDSLKTAYVKMVQKALPHLEKAQACDPSNETLAIIKSLYQKIKDDKGLATLDDRLKALHVKCLDILNDY